MGQPQIPLMMMNAALARPTFGDRNFKLLTLRSFVNKKSYLCKYHCGKKQHR